MAFQRQIPSDELFSAQLEMLMQNGRIASMVANLLGVLAVLILLWPYYERLNLFLWCFGILALILIRSVQMTTSLATRAYQSKPARLFWWLLLGSALTGGVWSATFIYVSQSVPATLEYVLLLIVVIITAISLAVMAVIREYFLAFVFTALWPIAWWCLVHPWDNPYNLLIGLLLLGVSALFVLASSGIHDMFRAMLSLSWQQESMSRELGQITNSMRDRNRQLREARQQLTELANIDELTGLGNRRVVNKVLREEVNRARRAGTSVSVVLIDVDHFKKYNDTYGHPAGDEALRRLGDLMQNATARAGEVIARYGGEEFIAILPNTELPDAVRTAERLQRLVREENIAHKSSDVADYLTISQGVASVRPDEEIDPGSIVDSADAALYRAKREGRNGIAVA
jgi:diguanylate cyclase (GGDEF)-like protein